MKTILPASIRWRLPLSYAAIALLATLALGLVLLTILRRHYHQQELDYLTNNARAISLELTPFFEADLPPELLHSQLDSLAFLSQSRIRLLNPQEKLLADSGAPQHHEIAALSFEKELDVEIEDYASGGVLSRTIAISNSQESYISFIAIKTRAPIDLPEEGFDPDDPADFLSHLFPNQEDVTVKENILITRTAQTDFRPRLKWSREGLPALPLFVSRFPTVGTPYGFEFGTEPVAAGQRSPQVVRQPFYGGGSLLGYVELSEGPTYGRQVLNSVAWGWAVASVAAVLLAMLAGWGVSSQLSTPLLALTEVTAQMAGGDLSVRANTSRHDEFGTLASRFNEMAHQVEHTVMTLRRFVADAAHELHTPLTALRTDLELMGTAEDPQKTLQLVHRAAIQVARLETLTNDLLDLSRLETKSVEVAYVPLVLNDLLGKLGETYASKAEQMGLNFSLDLPGEPFRVQGSEAQLHRAIGNLLDNALKFTPKGGAVFLGLHAIPGTDWLEVWVEDEGIGIPADEFPHLFSRFHRGRNTSHYPGSGLGLAIVKSIVEGHGGRVAAEWCERGARFVIQLPRVPI